MGTGVAIWKLEQSSSPQYERLCEGLLRVLPLLTVVMACAAVIFSHSMTALPRIVSISVDVGALTVILLAMVRQSTLLKERDQLLVAQEAVRQNEERLRFMLETCPIAVRIAKDSGHQVIFSNRSYAELINVKTGNMTSVDPGSYYANPKDYADVLEQLPKMGSIPQQTARVENSRRGSEMGSGILFSGQTVQVRPLFPSAWIYLSGRTSSRRSAILGPRSPGRCVCPRRTDAHSPSGTGHITPIAPYRFEIA
jgi:hypothetical protein